MSKEQKRKLLGDPLDPPTYEEQIEAEGSSSSPGRSSENKQESCSRSVNSTGDNHTSLGMPDPEPDFGADMHNVSAEEIHRLRQEQEDLQRQFEEKLLELEQAGIKLPRALYRFVLWAVIFLGAVLGLLLINQAVRFAGQVSVLSLPWNLLALAGFAVFFTVILVVVVKLFGNFLAFRSLVQIDLKALNLLVERRRFRLLAEEKKEQAKLVLIGYLQDFQIENQKGLNSGLNQQDVTKIGTARQRLLDNQGHLDASLWLQEFENNFVHILDKAARLRIRTYTRNVALGTAASPIKIIDQFIVLYASLQLINELLQIYNLRPALGQSATILARSVIQAYLSGVIGEHSEAGMESFADYYESIFGEISFASGLSAVTDATRYILPKASEGALNGFLLWRLGRQAQKMVRPV